MIKTYHDEQQPPCVIGYAGGYYTYTVNCHETLIEENGVVRYCYDTNSFIATEADVSPQDVQSNPEKYLAFICNVAAVRGRYIAAIQEWMDKTAQAHGYDNIFTATTYVTSTMPRYKAEADACVAWRDRVWRDAFEYMTQVLAGEEPLVSEKELIERLPSIDWPTE